MADRTIVLAQNKRHSLRGLTQINPQEFAAYQEDEDSLTYVVDMASYLDGAQITAVSRVPSGITITNPTITTTRFSQRLSGFGHVDFQVQTDGGDIEEFRIYIQPRAGSSIYSGTSAGGGGQITDGDKGDIVVSGSGSVWSIDTGVIVDADVNASAAIAPTKVAFTQAGTGASTRTVDAKLKDVVSVRDFGASPSETGANNVTYIQAAIDAVNAAGGGVIYFPPGVYTVASRIDLKSNVILDGGNRKATLSMTHSNTDPRNTSGQRYATNTVGVNISGELSGGYAAIDNAGIVGFRITHASPSGGKVVSAISSRNATNVVICNNEIFGFNCMVTGIRLASIVGGEIKDNVVRDCVMSDGMTGYVETYTGITGTTVPAAGTLPLAATLGSPVLVRVQASGQNLRPTRTFTYNAGTQNITLGSAAGATDTIYVQYALVQSDGVEIDNDIVNSVGSTQVVVSNNRISNIKFSSTGYNNWFMETDGINVGYSATRCSINDNVIREVGEGIDAFARYSTFAGNQFGNCGLFGLKMTHGASFNSVTNISVDGAGLAGVIIQGSSVNSTPCDGNVLAGISIQRLNYDTLFLAADCAAVRFAEESGTYTVSNTMLADVSADCGANCQYGFRDTSTSANNNSSALRIKGTHASFAPGSSLALAFNGGRTYTVNLVPGSPIIAMRFDDNAELEQVRNTNNGLTSSASSGSPQGIRYETLLGTSAAQNIVAYRQRILAVADWGTGSNRTTRIEQVSSIAGSTVQRSVMNGVGTSFGGGTAAGDPDAVITVNGVGSFGDGTAAAPSVAHKGDLDTGIYFPSGGNVVGIATNGASKVYIDTNGVGINTTSFSTDKLRVQGGASVRYFGVNTDGKAEQRWNDAAVINDAFTIANNGLSASNQGVGLRFNLDASNGAGNESAYVRAVSADTYAAAGNRSASLTFGTINANTLAERMRITSTGDVLVTGVGGLGYGTGSGGSITQTTGRTNGVILNKTNGAITLVSAAGSTTEQTFTVTNSTVAATDTVIASQKSGTDKYIINVSAVAAGSFDITFRTFSGTTTEQPVFNFAVIKAVAA